MVTGPFDSGPTMPAGSTRPDRVQSEQENPQEGTIAGVSETAQGPGWWLASDGRWYPPHLHPSVLQPTPPTQSPEDSSSSEAVRSVPLGGAPPWQTAAAPPSHWDFPPGYGPPQPGSVGSAAYGPPPAYGPPSTSWIAIGDPRSDRIDPVVGRPLAPWWKRLVAILIDWAILGLVTLIPAALVGALSNTGSSSPGSTSNTSAASLMGGLALGSLVLAIPYGIYFGALNGSRRGQTVGKMAMSIAVRDARYDVKVGFWRGFGRYFLTVVFDALFVFPWIIDSLYPFWDRRRQTWHDKLTHTVVIDLR